MKKLITIGLLLLATAAFGAVPTNNSAYNDGGLGTATITIDSQHTGAWKFIDSIAVTIDDTAYVYTTIECTAALRAGQSLYLGTLVASGDTDNTTAASDTTIIVWPRTATDRTYNTERRNYSFPINLTHLDSLETQTDSVFYFYLTGAVVGSDTQEEVALSGIKMSVGVINKDD